MIVPKPPILSQRFDRVQVALWENVQTDGERTWTQLSATVSRIYLDRARRWQRSNSFTLRDLPFVKKAVDFAIEEILLRQQNRTSDQIGEEA